MMVANAVSGNLGRSVADVVTAYERGRAVSDRDDGFRTWLAQAHGMTSETLGDVISRQWRVEKLLGSEADQNDPRDVVHSFSKLPAFDAMSPSVRSHLKRAVRLQAEYRESA